jgi:hypothetical protein
MRSDAAPCGFTAKFKPVAHQAAPPGAVGAFIRWLSPPEWVQPPRLRRMLGA